MVNQVGQQGSQVYVSRYLFQVSGHWSDVPKNQLIFSDPPALKGQGHDITVEWGKSGMVGEI
jgi:hypothetical protein